MGERERERGIEKEGEREGERDADAAAEKTLEEIAGREAPEEEGAPQVGCEGVGGPKGLLERSAGLGGWKAGRLEGWHAGESKESSGKASQRSEATRKGIEHKNN